MNQQDSASKGRAGFQTHPERHVRGDSHWTRTQPERLLRGEQASAVQPKKLSVEIVREIRRCCQTGELTQKEIARRFGSSQVQVCLISQGKRWGWVDSEATGEIVGIEKTKKSVPTFGEQPPVADKYTS